ncbi:MAG: hypothetical protein WD877_00930 [Candidatus Saccharimonadales bacterium]
MENPAKQQTIDRVKQANNILVTVSTNPSVDQLSACIGLTLLLNRLGKHATAVFSGNVPSTLEFLQPEKTIETTTDSLRDFIISLDKAKADKLRYKVEDQVVKIFITPYKTSLSEKDLVFSQGEYNVEAVLALGIKNRTEIDAAITAHGRILHDATVISLNAGAGKAPDLGQINWQDSAASSLCEMIVSLSEAFGSGLIDNQMATAFLTGIVAETKRFSNNKTSSKVMTISAQLMAAGANQQLIVSKLEPPVQVYGGSAKAVPKPRQPAATPAGTLSISHDEKKADEDQEVQIDSTEIHIDEQGNLKTAGDLMTKAPVPKPPLPPPPPPPPQPTKPPTPPSDMPGQHTLLDPENRPPTMGTPFSANTEPAWYDPYDTVPSDPLSETTRPGGGIVGQDTPPAVSDARSAVENAIAKGSSAPVFPDLADTPAIDDDPPTPKPAIPNGTPSLSLPTNGQLPTEQKADIAPPAPPPLPPPLMTQPPDPK